MTLTHAEKWYAKNEMVKEPLRSCEFEIGDTVQFTNDHGIEFGPFKVLGYTTAENELDGRFIYIDYDSPWFPVRPEELTIDNAVERIPSYVD